MADIHLFQGEANPNDVRLTDPTLEAVPLAATSTMAVLAVSASLTTTGQFAAVTEFGVAVDAPLTAVSSFEASAAIQIGTADAPLSMPSLLQAAAAVLLAVLGTVIVTGPLEAASTLAVSASPPALDVSHPIAGDVAFSIATSPTLTSVPAELASAPAFAVSVQGNLGTTGHSATSAVVTFNGVEQTRVRLGSVTIIDAINEAANTCDFVVDGTPPAIGTDIKIGLQNVLGPNLLFGGTVVRRTQLYELQRAHVAWSVSCEDYTFLINRRKVWGTWTNVSASTVAHQVVIAAAPTFSRSNIVGGLPAITITFDGDPVMVALTRIASLVGGYTYIDYSKDVHLYVTEAAVAPDALDGTQASLLEDPPVAYTLDETQVRTKVYLKGKGASVQAPDGFAIAAGSTAIPLSDTTPFSAGQVITDAAEVLNYTGVAAGGVASTVTGNVPGPAGAPGATIAPGAGHLSGSYQYKVAFGNSGGETTPGPASAAISAPDFPTPTNAPGVGATGTVGPLVGAYGYRTGYITALGETLPGPPVSRTAVALLAGATSVSSGITGISRLTPGTYNYRSTLVTAYGETTGGLATSSTSGPAVMADAPAPATPCTVSNGPTPGNLTVGATYLYKQTYLTLDGETAAGVNATAYTPSALSQAGLSSATPVAFGGLAVGPYAYGVTIVTAKGESAPLFAPGSIGSVGLTGAPGSPSWSGGQDTAGRIAPGTTYFWACSAYHDTYGETPLSAAFSLAVGGSVPIRLLMNLPALPSGAHGLRVYRAVAGSAYMLNAEFRAGSMPPNYWDALSTGENGSQFPVQTQRAGVGIQIQVNASGETGVVARRIYRTKAAGSEYFYVGELQHNTTATFRDDAFDAQLTIRSPSVQTTGRSASLTNLPTSSLSGVTGRRIYRTKAGGSAYYLIGEIKDNSTTSFTDDAPDAALTVAMPSTNTAGSVLSASSFQPRLAIPTGPVGTIARRIYRTKVNGSIYYLLTEVPNNTTFVLDDNTPDASLGATQPPIASTAGGDQHLLSSVPIGPTGTLARTLYRTVAGGSEYKRLGQISDNTTSSFLDTVPDVALGAGVPLVNTAGSSAVNLSGIPTGSASVTQRILYRTSAGGSDFKYLGTLNDNVTTTFFDDKADSALGRLPQAMSTIGALAGDTTVLLASVAGFPAAGWFQADSQTIRYAGISGTALIGIPASGAGAIVGAIRGGLTVKTVPMLTGVSGVLTSLETGDRVSLWVTCNSAAGQAALAATEGGDGVHEHVITDAALDSVAACTQRGNAELALFQYVQITVTYTTLDPKTRSGKTIHVALGPPTNLGGDFIIQRVVIRDIDIWPRTAPRYQVTASNTKFSLEDLLRHVVLA